LIVTVAACSPSPDEGPGPRDCAIDITLSGAISDHVKGPQYCGASGIYDSPAQRVKSWMDGPHENFGIELYDVSEGQTGTFQTTLSISKRTPGAGGWATGPRLCAITINEWRLVDDNFQDFWEYRYVGTGTCSAPAKPHGKHTGEVELSDFSVKNWMLWSH
jgi:hypothetical protein